MLARRWSLALFQVRKLQQYFTHNMYIYDTLVWPKVAAVYVYGNGASLAAAEQLSAARRAAFLR